MCQYTRIRTPHVPPFGDSINPSMVKRRIKKKPSRRAKPKPEVSRYEYALLCMQLAAVEAQVKRNRTDLDIQLRRIAQLQDELDVLKKTPPAKTPPSDSVLFPLQKITVGH